MDLTITADIENKLLKRKEVRFNLKFAGATPSRKQVKEALCGKIGANPDSVVIRQLSNPFGVQEVSGTASVYTGAEGVKIEHGHLLRRDRGEKGRPPKEATAAPAPAKPAAQKQEPAKEPASPKPASAKAEEAKPAEAKAGAEGEKKEHAKPAKEGAEQKKEHVKAEAPSEKK